MWLSALCGREGKCCGKLSWMKATVFGSCLQSLASLASSPTKMAATGACCEACGAEPQCTDWSVSGGTCC